MFVEMVISSLSIDSYTNIPFVVLKDRDDKKHVPIWIGLFEASAIATELESIRLKRPMTHDLLCETVRKLGGSLQKVEIHDLRDNTYFARLIIEQNNQTIAIDARPSDAIAIAIRFKVAILVNQSVIDKSEKIDVQNKPRALPGKQEAPGKDKWREILENLEPEDFGKYKM